MISLLLGALLEAAAPSAPPPAAVPKLSVPAAAAVADLESSADLPTPAVRATTSLPGLFSTDDYPAEAVSKEEQGTVTFRVWIDRDGRVRRCEIIGTSGSASLDHTTCAIVQSRARFTPARNAMGQLVEDSVGGRIRWQFPQDRSFEDRGDVAIFSIDARGLEKKCRAEGTPAVFAPEQICRLARVDLAHIMADARASDDLAGREVVMQDGFMIGDAHGAHGVGSGPGEKLIDHYAFSLSIDAAGKVVDCRPTAPLNAAVSEAFCTAAMKETYEALNADATNRTVRNGVEYSVIFSRPPSSPRK